MGLGRGQVKTHGEVERGCSLEMEIPSRRGKDKRGKTGDSPTLFMSGID